VKKLVAITGFLGGIAIAVMFLLHSPFEPRLLDLQAGPNTLQWQTLEFGGNPFTPAGLLGLPAGAAIVPIGASQVELANASIMLLFDTAGKPVALATRLASRRKGGNLLMGNIGIDTYTNVFWPNRGSVLLHGYEDRTPMLRAGALGSSPVTPDKAFTVSALAPTNAAKGVVGGSGALALTTGRFSEALWQSPQQPGYYSGAVTFEFSAPP